MFDPASCPPVPLAVTATRCRPSALKWLNEKTQAVRVRSSSTARPSTFQLYTAGAPAEQRFQLTPASGIPAGRVTFRVTNAGTVPHSFKLCSRPLAVTPAAGAPATCAGTATATLAPGRSATLTVTLTPGRWAFLSTLAGQAARGLRGVLTVVAAGDAPAAAPTVTSTAAASAPAPAPTPAPGPAAETLLGDPIAGLAIFQARVSSAVSAGAYGGIVMPAFTLSPTNLANIAAFVYSATHS